MIVISAFPTKINRIGAAYENTGKEENSDD